MKIFRMVQRNYGSDDLCYVKYTRGKMHEYLGMIIHFTQEGAFNIDRKCYIEGILKELPYGIKENQKTPWTEKLLKAKEDAKNLDK